MRHSLVFALACLITATLVSVAPAAPTIQRTMNFNFNVSLYPVYSAGPQTLNAAGGQATMTFTGQSTPSFVSSVVKQLTNVNGTLPTFGPSHTALTSVAPPATYKDIAGGELDPNLNVTMSHAGFVPPANTPGTVTLPHPYAAGYPASGGLVYDTISTLTLYVDLNIDFSATLGHPAGTNVYVGQPVFGLNFVLNGPPAGGNSGLDGTYSLLIPEVPYPELIAPYQQGHNYPSHTQQVVLANQPADTFITKGTVFAYATQGSLQITGSSFNASHLANWVTGDANIDGIVNGQDIAITATNWLKTGAFGANLFTDQGDINGDGIVNGQDIALIATHWLDTSPGTAAAVPEPATILLGMLGAISFMVRRKHRNRQQ